MLFFKIMLSWLKKKKLRALEVGNSGQKLKVDIFKNYEMETRKKEHTK